MSVLSFADIKANTNGREPASVDVPEWGGAVLAKRLNAAAGIAIGRMYQRIEADKGDEPDDTDLVEFYVSLLSNSLVGEDGGYLFASDDGREFLRDQDFALIVRLGAEVLKLNGMASDATSEVDEKKTN